MPRISAEARSAAAWRAGGKHPTPPRHLGREAKSVWKEIVGIRPPDYFEPGSLHLLETFCVHTVQLRRLAQCLDGVAVGSDEHAALVGTSTKLAASVAQLGSKLRLSIQAAYTTKDRRTGERGPAKLHLLGGREAG